MTTADRKLRIVYDGEDLTVQEWADRTGLPYATIYQRYFARKWSAEEALTTPYRSRGGRTPGRGPVEYAQSLSAGANWMVALRLAIVLMALRDYEDPYYRTDVELFFRDEFEKLFNLDGKRFLERLAQTA